MNRSRIFVACSMIALSASTASATTKVTEHNEVVTEKLPKPAHVWVYDFAATPADVPAESALAGKHSDPATPPTAADVEAGRKVGAEIATALVDEIDAMGLAAEPATAESKPALNDLVIRGYLVSVSEGNEAKRIAIGFGAGASELKVAAEGFQVTDQGLRKLGSGEADSKGSKMPGGALGVAALIATHNPVGLVVSTGIKLHGEATGSSTVVGRGKDIAKEIGGILKTRFKEEGWIQ